MNKNLVKVNYAPEGWLTRTVILTMIKDMPIYVTRRLEELRILQPKLYGIFSRHGVYREFYSPEIFLKIQEEVRETIRQKEDMKAIKRATLNRRHLKFSSYGSYASGSCAMKEDDLGSLNFDD